MPKKKLPEQVVVFKVKANAKVKGERGYPTRIIALDADSDLYSLAKAIVWAFDFDFDHAFGFFDDLKNPYQARVRFELFNDAEHSLQGIPDFLPQDMDDLAQLGLGGANPKDVATLMKAVQKIDMNAIQQEIGEEIARLTVEKMKQKLATQVPSQLLPMVDVLLGNFAQQMLEDQKEQAAYAPIETGVKGVSWQKAFLPERRKMCFLFDYGDDWTFEVELLGMGEPNPKHKYPALLESKGKAPEQYPDYEDD